MSTSPVNPGQSTSPAEERGLKSHLILPGLLLMSLCAAGYLGVNLWFARKDTVLLRQELRTTQASLKEAQLRLEANQVIIRRQMEMLRQAQQGQETSKP